MAVLDGKTAVVTGGSRGIGRAIVERLVRDGAEVVFTYARDDRAAAAVERAAAAPGVGPGSAHAVRGDLSENDAATRLMEYAHRKLGALDILVNNAAHARMAPIEELDWHDYDRLMTLNTRSVFQTVQFAARHMRDDGRVINISTVGTRRAWPGSAAYAASKGAVEQLTAVAARELGTRGITVNTVSPGATDTDLLRSAHTDETLAAVARATALGRLGRPVDIADAVGLLAGPDARWITGENIRVDGGEV
ncbi:SDR family oxidoreductase [Streptomyces abyssomicinicus]|uniref:SDR family oxidoreductase n=1 Tax=Streptomyces abyssomicinicus TaxID=574929 RepID=UPI00124FCC4D|nr:SDR family oxidoreductase [Streptomyces abyssomicinicus]